MSERESESELDQNVTKVITTGKVGNNKGHKTDLLVAEVLQARVEPPALQITGRKLSN